jgi:hypothetical protein
VPLYDRAETEVSLGAIHYRTSERYAIQLGAGVSQISFSYDGNF